MQAGPLRSRRAWSEMLITPPRTAPVTVDAVVPLYHRVYTALRQQLLEGPDTGIVDPHSYRAEDQFKLLGSGFQSWGIDHIGNTHVGDTLPLRVIQPEPQRQNFAGGSCYIRPERWLDRKAGGSSFSTGWPIGSRGWRAGACARRYCQSGLPSLCTRPWTRCVSSSPTKTSPHITRCRSCSTSSSYSPVTPSSSPVLLSRVRTHKLP